MTGLKSQRLTLRFWVNLRITVINDLYYWSIHAFNWENHSGYNSHGLIYSFMMIISLFPWYDIFISHFICTFALSLLLLARELLVYFCYNYLRLHISSSRTTSCLPHNFSLDVSILGHLFLWLQFAKHSNNRHLHFV